MNDDLEAINERFLEEDSGRRPRRRPGPRSVRFEGEKASDRHFLIDDPIEITVDRPSAGPEKDISARARAAFRMIRGR